MTLKGLNDHGEMIGSAVFDSDLGRWKCAAYDVLGPWDLEDYATTRGEAEAYLREVGAVEIREDP